MKNKLDHTAYVAIGSNMGERLDNCRKALSLLNVQAEIKVAQISNWYETEAVVGDSQVKQGPFLNGVAEVHTNLSPKELLKTLFETEEKLGRPFPRPKGEPRTVDLDILFYDNLITNFRDLKIPHPKLTKRLFVLTPLCDIAAALVHPVFGRTIKELKLTCRILNPSYQIAKLDGALMCHAELGSASLGIKGIPKQVRDDN